MAGSLRSASRRGLVERFDSTIGAGSILMPFGGKYQRTPEQAMAALLPVLPGKHTEDGSLFAQSMDPDEMCENPYLGAYHAVLNSAAKIVAAGGDYRKIYLSLQEFFEKLKDEPLRWGKPFSALLGALDAQIELGAAAIGGKDSMSGTFLDKDVPPTLISFAIAPVKAVDVLSSAFRGGGHSVYLLSSERPAEAFLEFQKLAKEGRVLSARAVESGGLAEAVMNMAFGNAVGFKAAEEGLDWYSHFPAAIIAELSEEVESPFAEKIGETTLAWAGKGSPENADVTIKIGEDEAAVGELLKINEGVLEGVYPTRAENVKTELPKEYIWPIGTSFANNPSGARPKAIIPVFPGTNCEYDSQRAMLEAGIDAEIFVIRNLAAEDVARSAAEMAEKIKEAQIIFIPGGFSGGDEPDGSAKLITAFFRNPEIMSAANEMLEERGGLMLGICNGFQALIKLGLVPYGRIVGGESAELLKKSPTLTFNAIGRHQSKIARVRVASNASPWLRHVELGEVYAVPISHGEGRIYINAEQAGKFLESGYVATQYCDTEGRITEESDVNPNGSVLNIEGLLSPNGHVFGKMGHAERIGKNLYKNVPGKYDMELFRSAREYFEKE